MTNEHGRIRRSLLITPAHLVSLVNKLASSPADVCVLELEDGVHPAKKELARTSAAKLLDELDWGGRERLVRINEVTTPEGESDVAAVVRGRPDAILLPKVESPAEVEKADSLIAHAEREEDIPEGTVQLWSMIESANALCRVEDICGASSRMSGILFGGGDLGAQLRVKRLGLGSFRRVEPPAHEYLYARGRVVAAARAAGIDPIDVGHSTYVDLEGTAQSAEYSAQMGFSGCIVFHPQQVPVVNEVFTPDEEDLEWAHEVVTAFEHAGEEEGTVAVVDGEMIDGPFVLNARDILARAEAIADYERRKARGS